MTHYYSIVLILSTPPDMVMCFLLGSKGGGKSLWILEIFVTLWFRYWRYSPLSCHKWNLVWFKASWQCDPNTSHTLGRKPCPSCPSWLLVKRIPDTGQSCISNLDHSSEDFLCSHIWRVFLGNKVDLKKVGCSTPLDLTSCLTYLLDCLFQKDLGTVRHVPVTGRRSVDTREI